jgi:gas vesicle protein
MMRGLMNFLTGALMGAVVGATLALLLTPESGNDLRGQIRDRAQSVQDEMRRAAHDRRAELEEQLAAMRAPRS